MLVVIKRQQTLIPWYNANGSTQQLKCDIDFRINS